MTFRKKLAKEHPECIDDGFLGGCRECPETYGYEEYFDCTGITCKECWDRKMPGKKFPYWHLFLGLAVAYMLLPLGIWLAPNALDNLVSSIMLTCIIWGIGIWSFWWFLYFRKKEKKK